MAMLLASTPGDIGWTGLASVLVAEKKLDANPILVILSVGTTSEPPVPLAAFACELKKSSVEDEYFVSLGRAEKLNQIHFHVFIECLSFICEFAVCVVEDKDVLVVELCSKLVQCSYHELRFGCLDVVHDVADNVEYDLSNGNDSCGRYQC